MPTFPEILLAGLQGAGQGIERFRSDARQQQAHQMQQKTAQLSVALSLLGSGESALRDTGKQRLIELGFVDPSSADALKDTPLEEQLLSLGEMGFSRQESMEYLLTASDEEVGDLGPEIQQLRANEAQRRQRAEEDRQLDRRYKNQLIANSKAAGRGRGGDGDNAPTPQDILKRQATAIDDRMRRITSEVRSLVPKIAELSAKLQAAATQDPLDLASEGVRLEGYEREYLRSLQARLDILKARQRTLETLRSRYWETGDAATPIPDDVWRSQVLGWDMPEAERKVYRTDSLEAGAGRGDSSAGNTTVFDPLNVYSSPKDLEFVTPLKER